MLTVRFRSVKYDSLSPKRNDGKARSEEKILQKNASQILGESLKYSSTQIGGAPAARERLAAH